MNTEVAYRTIETPIGELLLAATPIGLIRVLFENSEWDRALSELRRRVGPVTHDPDALEEAVTQYQEYFAGKRKEFTIPLDMQLITGFRRKALEHLREVPYGVVESYAEVAEAAGSPRASRAVGSACANNPLPIVIPCHRVLRADGSIGGYGGGLGIKERLLDMERGGPAVG